MKRPLLLTMLAMIVACEATEPSDTGETDDPEITVPDTYAFISRASSESSVAYDGQTMRHVLIGDLDRHLGALTARLDSDFSPEPGEVRAELSFYFDFDSATSGSVPHLIATTPGTLQVTYDDISSDKDLVGKVAGNDSVTDHTDWNTEFVGWGVKGSTTPEQLIRSWFDLIDAQAVDWSNGIVPLDPSGAPVSDVYITAEGYDLRQLIASFNNVSIAFSQGADDYLDDDVADKGILSDHSALVDGQPYTALEHQWDEGFGYFGASRDFGLRTDDEVVDTPAFDTDGDQRIDLESEHTFGAAGRTALRDRSSKVSIDLTAQAWRGFAGGRQLLAQTDGALTEAQLGVLRTYRDDAVQAWEGAIAATVLHEMNATMRDMEAFGTPDYRFADHARHWGALKGSALGLQFNRQSPLSADDFGLLHALIGEEPRLADDDLALRDAYLVDLRRARQLVLDTYGFDSANLGDDNGHDGW